MLPCHNKCVYKAEIPGDCHISCLFNWEKYPDKKIPKNEHSPRTIQWFIFPYNFDPVWGPEECEGYNTELKIEDKKEVDAVQKALFCVLANRIR